MLTLGEPVACTTHPGLLWKGLPQAMPHFPISGETEAVGVSHLSLKEIHWLQCFVNTRSVIHRHKDSCQQPRTLLGARQPAAEGKSPTAVHGTGKSRWRECSCCVFPARRSIFGFPAAVSTARRHEGGCRERGSLLGSQPALPALQQYLRLWPHAPFHSRI